MLRRSTVAVSTLVPALKVLSTVLLVSTFFSLVRTNAGPLPGLTCWNSTTAHRPLSMLRTMPFLRSLVVAMARSVSTAPAAALIRERPDHAHLDAQVVLAGLDRQGDRGSQVEGRPLVVEPGSHRTVRAALPDAHDPAQGLAGRGGVLLRLGGRLRDGGL